MPLIFSLPSRQFIIYGIRKLNYFALGYHLNKSENVRMLNNATRKKRNFLSRYCRANTYYIVKYNLRTEGVEAQISQSSYSRRSSNYGWGGYSGMDLAVDEQGLWLLWGSSSNSHQLRASKIDVTRNIITQTWSLNTGKHLIMENIVWI